MVVYRWFPAAYFLAGPLSYSHLAVRSRCIYEYYDCSVARMWPVSPSGVMRGITIAIGIVFLVSIVTNSVIYLSTRSNIFNTIFEAPSAEVVLIPGAAVSSEGALSPIFIDRIDLAIRLYEAKKV